VARGADVVEDCMKRLRPAELPLPALLVTLDEALDDGGVASLDRAVPSAVWRAALVEPAAGFLARPGKDLRARFVRAGWMLAGGDPAAFRDELAGVVELLHAGSLIVDDVQDDGETRRGGPALHRLVGVPLAINTGSWMYFWALAELARLEPAALGLAVTTLVRCHQGQALDLAAKIHDLDPADVPAVVAATTRLKTGALCRFATELGALAAGAPPELRAAIGELGEAAGSALQMLDDLGCIVAEARHAKACEDLRAARPTWPWAWLAEQRDPFTWTRLVGQLRAVVAGTGDPVALARALAARVEPDGRTRIRAALDAALERLREVTGSSPVLDALAADLRRMEESYG